MQIEFDPAKEVINVAKHGISLALAAALEDILVVQDERFGELRFRLYGRIEGVRFCAAVTMRGERVRIISLRRAHEKEFRRHG